MKLNPYLGPRLWRLALFMACFLAIKTQLNAKNQLVMIDSVGNFPFSTIRFQWAFDLDSIGGIHNEFLLVRDTLGGNDGIITNCGFQNSAGFYHTAGSTEPSSKLFLGPFDVRGMDSIAFAMHIAAHGILEHSDYVGIYVSLNGGKDYYPQLKLRGSKSGTKMKGWRHGEGIHYMKDFRWATRSSSIYGHVNPSTKDTINGISAISILDIPKTSQLMIKIELKSSTKVGEAYSIDNLSISSRIKEPNGFKLNQDTTYAISTSGTFICSDTLKGLYINVGEDTVILAGNPWLEETIHIASGVVMGSLRSRMGEGTISGNAFAGVQNKTQTLTDTGYHFIGFPGFFSSIDTLKNCWVYDAEVGYWDIPQHHYSGADSAFSMGRVIYLEESQVPMTLEGTITSPERSMSLSWADTCLDGTTPFGGWNLVANTTGRKLNWNQLVEARLLDSMDYTVYTWENGDYVGFNPYSGSTGGDAFIAPNECFWIRLSNTSKPLSPQSLELSRGSGAFKNWKPIISQASIQADTVHFEWITSGAYGAAYKASLFIDSAYKSTFMPCCDQLYLGGPLVPQIALIKGKTPLLISHTPKSTYYPIYLVGEGILNAYGAPGWFFLAPHIYPGNQPLCVSGEGPHKVYWLGADHPDISDGQNNFNETEVLRLPERVNAQDTAAFKSYFDLLGRPINGQQPIELRKEGRKWRKVIKVK